MKIIFYLGKGGVGKSSLSILNALAAGNNEHSVALISLDRAHNLFDILGAKPDEMPSNIRVIEADIDRFSRQYLKESEAQLRKNYTYLTAINLDKHFKVLRLAPGMEEFGLLFAFKHYYEKFATYDFLIFDMPPTAIALKFFGLPSVSLIWLQQLMKLREEILKKKAIISNVKFGKKEVETDKIKNNLHRQKAFYDTLLGLFQDRTRCLINVVSTPDSVSLAEARRIFQFLEALDISVNALFVNKYSENENIRPQKTFFLQNNVFLIPKSQHSLIGLDNLQNYLREHKILPDSLTKARKNS